MSEILPQFTYSPEGVLEITTPLADTDSPEDMEWQSRHLETLDESEAAVVVESDEDVVMVTIDIRKSLADNLTDDSKQTEFLGLIGDILPFYPEDDIDRVAGLEIMGPRGIIGVVYPQFQRWLNAEGVGDEVALEVVVAMATVFGDEQVADTKKGVQFRSDPWAFGVDTRLGKFYLAKEEEFSDHFIEHSGRVEWNIINLRTLGNCACWSNDGHDRDIYVRQNRTRLYEMKPHNVESAGQSLSLILGLGALTYRAAQYGGREDIFTAAEWSEAREYPKR